MHKLGKLLTATVLAALVLLTVKSMGVERFLAEMLKGSVISVVAIICSGVAVILLIRFVRSRKRIYAIITTLLLLSPLITLFPYGFPPPPFLVALYVSELVTSILVVLSFWASWKFLNR